MPVKRFSDRLLELVASNRIALQPIDQYRHAGHKARRAIAALEFPPGTFARLREQLFTEAASAPLWDPNLTWLPIAPLMLVKESSDLALKLSCVVQIAHRNRVFKKFTLDSRRQIVPLRVRHQLTNGSSARHRGAASGAVHRRRGDRIELLFGSAPVSGRFCITWRWTARHAL